VDDRDLSRRLGAVVGPSPVLDVDRLRRGARRARRTRRAQHAVAGVAVLAVLVPVGLAAATRLAVPDGPATAFDDSGALAPFDPVTDAAPGVPALAPGERDSQPTRLPQGSVRCAGPTRRPDGLVETTYCAGGDDILRLRSGTHEQLPEVGEVVRVARRDGYLGSRPTAADGASPGASLTVSDGNTLLDTHHELWGPLEPADLAQIAASIPAIAQAPPSAR